MKYSRNLLWTRCTIEILDCDFSVSDIETCFQTLEDFEKKYSRFKAWNTLSEINTKKSYPLSKELKTLIEIGIKLWDISEGHFDITMLPYLENAWYGISKNKLEENIWYKHIELTETEVILHDWVCIEFGAYGKWYMLDRVYSFLSQKYKHFILDFGGDIKVHGSKEIYLENPEKTGVYYWKIVLENASITSSNGAKRSFWDGMHHLIDTKNWKSSHVTHTVFCYHSKWIFSDGFATLLSLCPKELSADIMKRIKWLEAFIIYTDGSELRSGRFITLDTEKWYKK